MNNLTFSFFGFFIRPTNRRKCKACVAISILVFGYGCGSVYANYNQQPRDKLEQRSSLMDDVIQFLRQEKETLKQRIDKIIDPKK